MAARILPLEQFVALLFALLSRNPWSLDRPDWPAVCLKWHDVWKEYLQTSRQGLVILGLHDHCCLWHWFQAAV